MPTEDLRRKLMAAQEFVPAKESKAYFETKSAANARTPAIEISSSDEESTVGTAKSGSHSKPTSRTVISDTDSDEENENSSIVPTTSKSSGHPDTVKYSQPLRPYNSVPGATVNPYGQSLGGLGYQWQSFNQDTESYLRDPYRSAEQVEKDLQELVSQTFAETEKDVDLSMNIVNGFRDEIRLLPHQVVGRAWMAERETDKKRGGILADDMGLGKTIQTLTRIVDGRPTKEDKKLGFSSTTLIICPVALVGQWASEVEKMTVGLRVIEHHGPKRTKDPSVLEKAHVVITTYATAASEYNTYKPDVADESNSKSKHKKKLRAEDYSDDDSESDSFGSSVKKSKKSSKKKNADALFRVKWWRIVLDEAHNIKNKKTKNAEACFDLEGRFRWCLTGTPLQNNVEELYSLLRFLQIRPLMDWDEFNNKILKPMKNSKTATAMQRLQVVLKAIMLRRQKDTLINGKPLLELPDRIVDVVPCEFDADERTFYTALETKIQAKVAKFMEEGQVMKNYTSVLVLLLRLRQACDHPSLVTKDFAIDSEAVEPKTAKNGNDLADGDDLADLFGQMGVSSGRKCHLCQTPLSKDNVNNPDDTHCAECVGLANTAKRKYQATAKSPLPPGSAKIKKTLELLNKIEERSQGEEKTIIFSQFTSMLNLVQPFLEHDGIKFVRYDGSMNKQQREAALEKIKSDKSVKCILISFKAGSTGLNLTVCNNVILLDLWWNPALEDQAFDRAHRFGQTRQVNIYKLTIEETVEQRILDLQDSKRKLASAALSGDKVKNSKLRVEDLLALFRFDH